MFYSTRHSPLRREAISYTKEESSCVGVGPCDVAGAQRPATDFWLPRTFIAVPAVAGSNLRPRRSSLESTLPATSKAESRGALASRVRRRPRRRKAAVTQGSDQPVAPCPLAKGPWRGATAGGGGARVRRDGGGGGRCCAPQRRGGSGVSSGHPGAGASAGAGVVIHVGLRRRRRRR